MELALLAVSGLVKSFLIMSTIALSGTGSAHRHDGLPAINVYVVE